MPQYVGLDKLVFASSCVITLVTPIALIAVTTLWLVAIVVVSRRILSTIDTTLSEIYALYLGVTVSRATARAGGAPPTNPTSNKVSRSQTNVPSVIIPTRRIAALAVSRVFTVARAHLIGGLAVLLREHDGDGTTIELVVI